MNGIMTLLYFILVLGVIASALFVLYHLLRYSLSKSRAIRAAALFLSGFFFLLITNIILFSQLDWESIIATTVKSSL